MMTRRAAPATGKRRPGGKRSRPSASSNKQRLQLSCVAAGVWLGVVAAPLGCVWGAAVGCVLLLLCGFVFSTDGGVREGAQKGGALVRGLWACGGTCRAVAAGYLALRHRIGRKARDAV